MGFQRKEATTTTKRKVGFNNQPSKTKEFYGSLLATKSLFLSLMHASVSETLVCLRERLWRKANDCLGTQVVLGLTAEGQTTKNWKTEAYTKLSDADTNRTRYLKHTTFDHFWLTSLPRRVGIGQRKTLKKDKPYKEMWNVAVILVK